METSTIFNSSNDRFYAVAYDSMASKLYFSSSDYLTALGKIYRANLDGTDLETVLSSSECKLTQHLFQL